MRTCEEEADGLMIVEHQQDEREAKHTDNLSHNANIIDDGYKSHSSNVNECADIDGELCNEDSIGDSMDFLPWAGDNGRPGEYDDLRCYCDGEFPGEGLN